MTQTTQITATPGRYLELDNGRAEILSQGCETAAAFPAPCGRFSVDCSVQVTGRSLQRRRGSLWVRTLVKWEDSIDESAGIGGWLMVHR
jgi:hypothetical protein